ncbi:MAG: antitoxin Xre/MbcA/ParS toxin-binding domain-containing protein [Methylophilaceae bacterium]
MKNLVPSVYDEIEVLTFSVFGDSKKAKAWMATYNFALQATPLEMFDRKGGKDEILKVLNSIRYGDVI